MTGVHPLSGTTLPGHSALTNQDYIYANGLSTRLLQTKSAQALGVKSVTCYTSSSNFLGWLLTG